MPTHDPRQVIEDVRNHLAGHDRRVAFLFGAGTSCAVNVAPAPKAGERPTHEALIPAIDGLTSICKQAVSKEDGSQAKAWAKLVEQCDNASQIPNIENILSSVRMKIDAIGHGETLVGLTKDQLVEMETTICGAIAATVNPAEEKIPESLPHYGLASWAKRVHRTEPLELFTTNYDILLERAFEARRVPVFDGFVGTNRPFFYPECVDDDTLLPGPAWVRLWKLHGSVNWQLEDAGSEKRIVRLQPRMSGELILPSHRKYDEARKLPYLAYMDRLVRFMGSEHALLITCGYSFRDEHINAVLYGALDNLSTANVIALFHGELKEEDALVGAAMSRSNLTVVGGNAGVISGMLGQWQLAQPVDEKTCSFMDVAFDSNALPEDQGSPAATTPDLMGRLRLGDFNWFCRFLNAMADRD